MPQISKQESLKYIPLTEDYTGLSVRDCPYWIFESQDDGWERVIYFTPKLRFPTQNQNTQYSSRVYVLSNPSIPNQYKIGYTKGVVENRAKQLSRSTSIPTGFKIEYVFNCHNAWDLEKEVHQYLKGFRVTTNKEFFTNILLKDIISIIEVLGRKYT